MPKKDDKLVVTITTEEKEEITEIAEGLDLSASQFMRQAAREKIASLRIPEQEPAPATT